MPQTFHVLRCCRCEVFQVQQEKKVKKWTCKMCGEKQSVLRVSTAESFDLSADSVCSGDSGLIK